VTRTGKSAEVVTLSAKDWLTLVGILMPIVILVIFGWIRHDRLLTEVAANQIMLKDRMERVEVNLDGIRP
jgi:type IV secretory pathway TrbD component